MNIVIFDSSTIINFAMNGILELIERLKQIFQGKFIITAPVKYETIDRPRQIKKFELGALKIKQLLDLSIFQLPESLGITSNEVEKKTKEILSLTNHAFASQEKWMEIIHSGEASCIALSIIASAKGINNLIAIDERTTRMLCEKPENLHQLFEKKMHAKIEYNKGILIPCRNIKIIRSAELVYIAYKKNLFAFEDPNLLDALLYGVKFRGCSISEEEINEIKRMK